MFATLVQTRITLDELAAELLPAPLITAVNAVTVERWRRQAMKDQYPHRRSQSLPAPTHRVLPVVVFGQTVFQPLRFPDPLVVHIEEGKSYRAMREAMRTDSTVLMVFVAEAELAGYRSMVPQVLPNVGVIARVTDVSEHHGAPHYIQIDGLSRANVLVRIAHAPFYRAACAPHPDARRTGRAVAQLVRQVQQQVTEYAAQISAVDAPYGLDFVQRMVAFINSIEEPGRLADACAAGPMFSFGERLALLQMFDPVERLQTVRQKLSSAQEG